MKVSDIIQQVRIVLDYNEETDSVDVIGDTDTLKLDDIIVRQIEPAARQLTLIAPEEYVTWTNAATETTGTSDESHSYTLPDGYLRFGSIKMQDWPVAIDTLSDMDSKEYKSLAGEFSGLKPCKERPIALLTKDMKAIETHGYGTSVEYMYVAVEPKLSWVSGTIHEEDDDKYDPENASDVELVLKDQLYQPLIYCVSSYVSEALKDTQKSNTLMEFVIAQLGLQIGQQQQAQQAQQ